VKRAWAEASAHALWFSATPLRISCVVRPERVAELEGTWHEQFVGSGSSP
jgi:hypothetical protein